MRVLKPLIVLLLGTLCKARVAYDASCNKYAVMEELEDALTLARNAAAILKAGEIRDSKPEESLYSVLFREDDRATVIAHFEKAAAIKEHPLVVRIFCDEATIIWPKSADKKEDKTTRFQHNGFRAETTGDVQTMDLASDETTPRKTICEKGALGYTLNGMLEGQKHQASIILCPIVWDRPAMDTRRVGDILAKGVMNGKSSLGHIEPVSSVLLHELTHTRAVGDIHEGSHTPFIDDGPARNTYGFRGCVAAMSSGDITTSTTWIADCYRLLGTGLYLQYPERNPEFTWATGIVTPDTYLPYPWT